VIDRRVLSPIAWRHQHDFHFRSERKSGNESCWCRSG